MFISQLSDDIIPVRLYTNKKPVIFARWQSHTRNDACTRGLRTNDPTGTRTWPQLGAYISYTPVYIYIYIIYGTVSQPR